MREFMLIYFKLIFAVLVLAAIGAQIIHSGRMANFNPANFFSFFTIESNILAAVLFLVSAFCLWSGERSATLDYARGAATLYMMVTGIVYSTLLASTQNTLLLPWVNLVLHYVFPIIVLVDWTIDPPGQALIASKALLLWLAYPLIYLAYSLVRGAFVHWYPYPFLDAAKLGYTRVALNCAGIAVGAVLLTLAIVSLPRISRRLT